MKKKKKAKKRTPSDFPCDVPECDRWARMGWKVGGEEKRICKYHFNRHCNKDDSFDLFLIFKIKKFKLDGLGFVEARDHKEMTDRTERQRREKKKKEKEDSLARLRDWKEENGNRPKLKRKPTSQPRPNKAMIQGEVDNIVGGILNGD